MIDYIALNNVYPKAFETASLMGCRSEVWQNELCFERGRSYLIEAESGRGKTSLCNFLYGLRTDYSGEIQWRTTDSEFCLLKDKDKTDVWIKSLAVMFQNMQLFPELTAVQNIMLKNLLTDYRTENEIRQQLKELGLADKADTPIGILSLGQQQRVAFLRAICQSADFCLLDEPISHLDLDNAKIMCDILKKWQDQEQCGIIVTSIGHRLPFQYDYVWHL